MLARRIVVTDDGVYNPKALVPRLVLYVVGLLFIAAAGLAGRLPPANAAMYFALLGVPFGWAFYIYRKYGKLGRPSVALTGGELHMDQPQRSDGMKRFPLARLTDVLIYGMQGKRIYRFSQDDGAVEEVSPLWGRHVESAVIQFLVDRLPPTVKVKVEEPMTLFASMRGDKPQGPA
jgi:hypothetical protein